MGAGLFDGEPVGDPDGVPCDPGQWSDGSKRSVAYQMAPRPYVDKAYRCARCQAPDVYTAAEQRHTFEVRKANIAQNRVHCRACFAEQCRLVREVQEYRHRWASERAMLRHDPEFLIRWLGGLDALTQFGYRCDRANIIRLRRLLADES